MSILDGKVLLANEKEDTRERRDRGDNRNRSYQEQPRRDRYTKPQQQREPRQQNNRNRRPNNDRRSQRMFDPVLEDFATNSSYLPEEERTISPEKRPVDNRPDKRVDELIRFCDEFIDSKDNYRTLKELITDELPEIITYMKSYYSSNNSPAFQDALNKLLMLFCTTQFATCLEKVLDSGIWLDDNTFDRIYDSIGFCISVALETNHDRMHTDVIRTYIFKIISRLYKPEIADICNRSGVTNDLALDLMIAIPIAQDNWNSSNIDAFAPRFLDKMLIHAEDNVDILNWEIQSILYTIFFGKGKTALKVIGKYLISEKIDSSESDIVNAVYNEFQKMLYKRLDKYDINDIEYVFRFVAKYRSFNLDKKVLFDSVEASHYDNVRKGLLSVIDENPDNMTYLA